MGRKAVDIDQKKAIILLRDTGTVHFPNSVGKFLTYLLLSSVRLLYIRSKIFSYLGNLWSLLFQMIYYSSCISHFFIAILSVYEKWPHLTELGSSSLILTVSKKISSILTLLINYTEKLNFRKKLYFSCFRLEIEWRCQRHFCRADQALS